MMTQTDFNGYGEELEKRLRLKTFPLALKMLARKDDIPEGAIRPKKDLHLHLALCQGWAMSRREGTSVAMLKEDMWCYVPVMAFGFAQFPEYYLEGHMGFPSKVSSLAAAKKMAHAFPRLEYGGYVGVVSAPLKAANFEPDLVVIYCNSVQLMSLLSGVKYREGHIVTSKLDPSAACVQCTVPALHSGDCQVSIPCLGDRRLAMAQDDEMIFSVPKERLEDLISGLRHSDEIGNGLPVKFEMRPDYPLSEGYAKMGKMLGMEIQE